MMRIAFILSFILSLACASYGQMQMSMRGGGKPIYYPFQLDSLFYWFDAMDASSLLDSVGGAVSNNEGVATWADKSGRNWDVTQGTNTARPVYKATGGPGGNTPAVQFDGSNDFLASAAHFWGSDDLTLIIVYKNRVNTGTTTYFVLSRWDGSLAQRQWTLREIYDAPNLRADLNVTPNGTTTNTISPDNVRRANFHVSSIIYDHPNTSYSWHIDGTDGTPSAVAGSPTSAVYDVSQKLGIGTVNTDSTPTAFFDGSISEIIVYSRALSDSERVGVEQYLKQKWGL